MILVKGYKKAMKVIDSCENEYHIKAAKRYCNNFFTNYATEQEFRYNSNLFLVDTLYAKAYDRLLKRLLIKERSL